MSSRLALAAVMLLGFGLLAATCRRETAALEPPPARRLDPARVADDLGLRAYRHVATLVGFGPRHTGSPGWRRSLEYIAGELERLGLEPVRDRWTDPDEELTFENIHVTLPGESRHRIVIACHHDTKRFAGHSDPKDNFPFVGANDSGSGVGLLLALAEELRDRDGRATIQLVFFDGEESVEIDWNMERALFGSRRFVRQYRRSLLEPGLDARIRCLVLLDMVGAEDLQIDEDTNSDPDLIELFRAAAAACGHAEHFFREAMAISDDHLPFLEAGIPSIDLIDLADNPQWHTREDTLEHVSADSLQIVGEVVLTALPALEERYFPSRRAPKLPERR